MTWKTLRIVILPILLFSCAGHERADLVITGGTVYTVDDQMPTVQGVAVRDGRIVFAGAAADAKAYIGEGTAVIDLQGKTMTPGIIEGHGHLMGVGYNALNLDLMDVTSYDALIERVRQAVQKAKPGQWIVGRGWHQDKWDTKPEVMVKGFPVHKRLSEVSPDNPVFLRHASGHAALANGRAMEVAGVTTLSVEKLKQESGPGGEVIRDALGNPTGIFNERAMMLITDGIPEASADTDNQALTLALQACAENGITSFHDAGASRENIALYHAFRKADKLTTRLYVMITGYDRDLVHEWFSKGPEVDTTGTLTIRAVKLNCDGALGSRGAWLLQPYTDRPDTYGMATLSMDTVLQTSRLALKAGFQVCSHAIGDRANREILDRYEQAFKEAGSPANHRFRIEHAQHIDPADLPRFAGLGVLPAMQAIHMSSDRPWAIERLGEKRIKAGAYMWQSLLRSGTRIINGTDAPVEPLNPVACFYASVTRRTLKGEPRGGFEPAEKMTRQQALRSYTLDAAYGAFEEKLKGSVTVGKLADFTVFSKDLMTVPEDSILQTKIVMTIVGGKVIYKRGERHLQ